MDNSSLNSQNNSKKTYSRLKSSSLFHFLKTPKVDETKPKKKIIATEVKPSLREDFKKTFLPLLIDVFELRQMIDTYKTQKISPELSFLGKVSKTPQEVLEQLKQLQNDVEESQRWCNGVILQISKGINEAKEALDLIENPNDPLDKPKKTSKLKLLKHLLSKFRR